MEVKTSLLDNMIGVGDLVLIEPLSEDTFIENLKKRFDHNEIYVSNTKTNAENIMQQLLFPFLGRFLFLGFHYSRQSHHIKSECVSTSQINRSVEMNSVNHSPLIVMFLLSCLSHSFGLGFESCLIPNTKPAYKMGSFDV